MKKLLFLLLIIAQPIIGFCQKTIEDKEISDRILRRVCKIIDTLKEYKEVVKFISTKPHTKPQVLIYKGDSTNNESKETFRNIITIKIGYNEIEPDGFIPIYYVYYSIKDKKIIRILKK